MQPVCTAISTPCHAGRGLAGHPRCISVVNEHGKTRLFTLIRSKTTVLPRCARQLSAQRRRSCPPCRGDEFAGKIRILNYLDDWLISVAGGFDIAQDPPPQPLRLPGAKGQLCQEHTVIQPKGIVPGYSNRLGADDSYCLRGASHHNSASRGFLQGRHRPSAQSFAEDAGPYGSGFKSSQVTFIYIALLTIQIVTKQCTISK